MKSLGTTDTPHDRKVEIRVIARVMPYLWPKGQAWVKWRVVIAVASLISVSYTHLTLPTNREV